MEVEDTTQLNESATNSNTSLNKCEPQNDISATGKRGSNNSNLSNFSENVVSPSAKGGKNLY